MPHSLIFRPDRSFRPLPCFGCLVLTLGVCLTRFETLSGEDFPPTDKAAFRSSILSETCVRAPEKSCSDASCHPRREVGRNILHPLYLEGRCSRCHLSPSSLWAPLARAWPDGVCLTCHTKEGCNPITGRVAHPPDERSCAECHDPHQSRIRNLIRSEKELAACAQCHASFLEQSAKSAYRHEHFELRTECGFCHYAHRAGQGKFVRENAGESCLTCHDLAIPCRGRSLENVARRVREAPVVHAPLRQAACPTCHTPHGSPQPALLKGGYPAGSYDTYDPQRYALCMKCHPRGLVESAEGVGATDFRDDRRNLHRLHLMQIGRGRACHLCHEAHASDRRHLLRNRIEFGRYNAPLGFEALAEGGGRCSTPCHRDKTYRRTQSLSAEFPRAKGEREP